MKFDIAVNGTRLNAWSDAQISLDQQYSASAKFTIHSAGAGPWLTNLSKVLISGRPCKPEAAAWGFEAPTDLSVWRVSPGLTSAGLDYTQSAHGTGSWAIDWDASQKTVTIYHPCAIPYNLNGMVFWGWFHLAYRTPFQPQILVQAYATDGTYEWSSSNLALSSLATVGWQAIGLRAVPTFAVDVAPTKVTEWGFRLWFTPDVPAAQAGQVLFRLNADSFDLCGKPYAAAYQLPPFPAVEPQGCLHPATQYSCQKWDAYPWANELHQQPGDAGWCVAGILWDQFVWASATNPLPTDAQWG